MAEKTILGGGENAVANEPVINGGKEQKEQTPQAQAFDFGKMIGAEGLLADNWREGLPESIRAEKCLDPIKSIGALAQSYVHAQKAVGANKIALPNENSSDEEWAAFYRACGRPEKEDGYTTDKISLPEGVTLDEGMLGEFRKYAFEHGFSQKAFEAALSFDAKRAERQLADTIASAQSEYNGTLAKLKEEYGSNYSTVVAQCNKAMATFGLTEVLRDKGLLNNYTIIKALAGIGEKISESRLKGNEAVPNAGDPASRLAEIQGNPDDPFYKKDHPAHNARVAEVNNLLAAMATSQKK